eukprot:jgi/Mesen1/9030/ME000565S08352
MDENQNPMKFGMDEDYEGGQWIAGEYFFSKKKEKRRQTKDDSLYGIFNESDSDEGGGGGGKRRRGGGIVSKGDLQKPVNFVSTGAIVPDAEALKKDEEAASSRPGLGSMNAGSAGLGFGQAGLGFGQGASGQGQPEAQGAGQEEEDDDHDVFKTPFGQQIKEAAKRKQEQEKEKEKEKEKVKVKRGAGKADDKAKGDLGSFEKHTKGIGMKLLEKMGYTGGGLGKNRQGIAAPVEAKLRPKNMGMGFNDFEERKVGLPAAPGQEEEESAEEKVQQAKKPQEKLWKKKHAGKKKEYKTAAQLLEEGQAQGREVRVLTNLEHMNAEHADLADNTPMPELQHNLRLIVDLAEADIQMCDRRLRHERDSLVVLQRERERAAREAALQRRQLDALEAIVGALDALQASVDAGTASLESLTGGFRELRGRHPEEYAMYNVAALALAHALPMMSAHFHGWNALLQPAHGVPAMALWQGLLAPADGNGHHAIFTDLESVAATDPYVALVREAVLPAVRFAVTNAWEPRDPEPVLQFLEAWEGLLPPAVQASVLEQLVVPKLTAAVDHWDPRLETVPVHAWLHPWLPLLGARLEPLYAPIRFKLGKALQAWHPSDPSAHALLAPWQAVFDSASWEQLMARSIEPKLAQALVHELAIDPADARSPEPFAWVMAWAGAVPAHRLVALLEAFFFRRWKEALYALLLGGAPNYEFISQWYLQWKAQLAPALLAHERVREQLHLANAMMLDSVSGALQPFTAYEGGAFAGVPDQPQQQHAFAAAAAHAHAAAGGAGGLPYGNGQQPPAPPMPAGAPSQPPPPPPPLPVGEEAELSLKDVVEKYAQDHDVHFLPKPGRAHEGLPVYGFGQAALDLG